MVYYLPILFSCQGTDVREGRTECQTLRSVSSETSPVFVKVFRLTRIVASAKFGWKELRDSRRLPGPRILRPFATFVNAAGTTTTYLLPCLFPSAFRFVKDRLVRPTIYN